MSDQKKLPRPVFDTLEQVVELYKACQIGNSHSQIQNWLLESGHPANSWPEFGIQDYLHVLHFLYSYRGSLDTFNAYRRELEKLIQWTWYVKNQSILSMRRADIEDFIEFCQKPYKGWIGTKTLARYITEEGRRRINPSWRPFIVKVSKRSFQDGQRADSKDFTLSSEGVKQIFAILGSFYNYLVQEEITEYNPILQIRQKSKFVRKHMGLPTVRRLSDVQWRTVIETAQEMAETNPQFHERTLFIVQALYSMYLRISELAASARWIPMMQHFSRDSHGDWWFKTVGKGNKMRQIAVSPFMIEALKRWRQYLQLPTLPATDEQIPLIPKAKGKGPIASTRAIRVIVQHCFDRAINKLHSTNPEEAELLRSVTVHWLRHTGISDDVKIRPREHVRDDAGHSSSAITDRYIDVELQERAKTAKRKILKKSATKTPQTTSAVEKN